MLQGQVDMVHSTSSALNTTEPIWNLFELPFIFEYNESDPSVYLESKSEFLRSENGGQKLAEMMEQKDEQTKSPGFGLFLVRRGLHQKNRNH